MLFCVTCLVFAHLFGCVLGADDNNKPKKHEKRSFLSYDFILGFSTGHVGTTSLSEGKLYGNPEHVVFLHESNFGHFKANNVHKERWRTMNKASEYDYVKSSYYPFLVNCRGDLQTLLDLGHHNLFFIDGLVRYLTNETMARVMFVRIRRDRLESALSLTFDTPKHQYDDLCNNRGLVYRYCPFERTDDVILKVPSKKIWNEFSIFQKALWMVDETDARWQRLLREFPKLPHLDVLWGKRWPGSLDAAASSIATLLSVNSTVAYKETWRIGHVHAGGAEEEILSDNSHAIADRQYRKKMGYKYVPA